MNDLKGVPPYRQTEPDPVTVGAAIRDFRRRRHWSQAELARRIGMRHSLPLFLADCPNDHILVKFIRQRIDLSRIEGVRLAA